MKGGRKDWGKTRAETGLKLTGSYSRWMFFIQSKVPETNSRHSVCLKSVPLCHSFQEEGTSDMISAMPLLQMPSLAETQGTNVAVVLFNGFFSISFICGVVVVVVFN